MAKLFISHASSDLPLVKALVDLIESGVGVVHESIFCSSLKGQNIKPGKYFIPTIKTEIEGAECVLVLVTENYFASHFCLCELGASWLVSKRLIPFAAPKLDQGLVKAVLEGMTVSSIQNAQDLDEMRDMLVADLGIKGHSTPRWNDKREAFLAGLPACLKGIEPRGPVARETHEKIQRELREYQVEYGKKGTEVTKLKRVIDALKATKDRVEVARVVSDNSDAVTQFETLSARANKALGKLGPVLHEAIYYDLIGDDYVPTREDADDARRMVEEGQLREGARGEVWVPDTSAPAVREAVNAVLDLKKWLDAPASQEFWEWYEEEIGMAPDISKRPFWRKFLL